MASARTHFASGRDFALARLGAARSGLLAGAGLRDLVARASLADRLAALRNTLWAAAAEAGSLEEAEATLEARAHREALSALRDLDPPARRLVDAFLLPDDARALRGAIRAVAFALAPEAAASLLSPTPALGRDRLVIVAACPDAASAAGRIAAWGSPFADVLRASPDLHVPGALAALEVALDRAAGQALRRAARGPGADRRVLRELASARADVAAAAELLALASEPGREAFPVEGGDRLTPAVVDRIATLPSTAVPAALADALQDLLGDVGASAAALARPSLADHVLGRGLARAARRAARRDPLTIAVPCAWLVEVGEELRRLRLVLRATAEGFPPAPLLDLLEA
jgi:vacuolar-type H+-ATPase subunit C/Vma6